MADCQRVACSLRTNETLDLLTAQLAYQKLQFTDCPAEKETERSATTLKKMNAFQKNYWFLLLMPK